MKKNILSQADNLRKKALWVWQETLAFNRRAPETRLATSLSPIEIFVAIYYRGVITFNPSRPLDEERGRCIISNSNLLLNLKSL